MEWPVVGFLRVVGIAGGGKDRNGGGGGGGGGQWVVAFVRADWAWIFLEILKEQDRHRVDIVLEL